MNDYRKRILIADDSELNREMLTDILGNDYSYVYAADGEETVKLLSERPAVDILLLDMNMPKLSGMQVLKAMRERGWTKEIPVVIISAETDDNFIKNAYYLGATDYIVRPFNAFLVQHRVENTLMMYSQKKQLVKLVESQVFRREKINNMLITIFSHVIGLGNKESGQHTINVQTITNMLLKKLIKVTDKYHLSEGDIALISSVSSLHDIGKLIVPENILNKPGKLTEEEWEIMKNHTVGGDEFLHGIPIDQSEQLMVVAHEICRYHHERWDGGGYPDGLSGDDIPISAQAVSIADVYDALTSERCYKAAYTHAQAVDMILNGECGAFNPILIECFRDISDDIAINLKLSESGFGLSEETYTEATEVLKSEALYDGMHDNMTEAEKAKKEFFADRCRGIQFEYDAVLHKLNYMRYYDENGERKLLKDRAVRLLSEVDWKNLSQKVKDMTRDNPDISMTALIPINGKLRWHKIFVRSIWENKNSSYISLVGQFTDIHDKVMRKAEDFVLNDKAVRGETLLAMCDIFDVVRVVNPKTCGIMKVNNDGSMIETRRKCYKMWNRDEPCQNCTSQTALSNKNWMSKLEVKDGILYSVLSRYVQCGGEDYALEVAFCIDDSPEKTTKEIGFFHDSVALKNYYIDTLTKTYSRAYLENFMPNLENARGIAIADIDDFKNINDTYGHIAGDAALKHISDVIKSCIRKEDVLIRYGGDEFLLVFDNISEEDFFSKLQNIKETVHESQLAEYPQINHDISIGGAYGISPFSKALDTADKQMYKDKFKNKNWERR